MREVPALPVPARQRRVLRCLRTQQSRPAAPLAAPARLKRTASGVAPQEHLENNVRNAAPASSAPARFDPVPDHGGDVGPAEILYRTDAGGRRDVDLGQIAVDHIDADEEKVALPQGRPEPIADLALPRC